MSFLKTLIGDTHLVRGICLPPNIIIGLGESKSKTKLYRKITKILQAGDIIVTKSEWYLSNLFIPGKYKHAIVYVGALSEQNQMLPQCTSIYQTAYPRMCVHATSEGVKTEDLLSILLHIDKLAIFRSSTDQPLGPELIAYTALKQLGKKYDFSFNWLNNDQLCCTELVDLALASVNIFPKQVKHPVTRKLITLADCYLKTDKLIQVFGQD